MSIPAQLPIPEREHVHGDFSREELALANRNAGMPLEALRHDVTPTGLHYRLIHFDIPYVAEPEQWRLEIGGLVEQPVSLSLSELQALPMRTLRVTLECAGNGRADFSPRWQSMPWTHGAVSTADWTGTTLRGVLEHAGVRRQARDIVFAGVDRGIDYGMEHVYERSLSPAMAMQDDVLLAWAMNGEPLQPQHGFPLRLIVPGWFGMASVKWLRRIEAIGEPFRGPHQIRSYMYRRSKDDAGSPVTTMRVKSLLIPPGITDWYSRRRFVEAGHVELFGRAWAGGGEAIGQVDVAIDGVWQEARLGPQDERYAWVRWRFDWKATPGEHRIACRATTASGKAQPLELEWDSGGFGNNAVHQVNVTVT
jgi:DMSO/TMAO reductase YedYZ molybdopterin-dependent catalytic subunit